ncbi:MAG: hypothetical protein G3M78_12865 [Candidatus Nitrohelix vancouverensis]|uniref:Uncharacterized protein n=1 Tax=Candidatus Nitrohelix vancouverensis TaxID=2705534 RepID=A0A7T0C466_9BACT|nr:MAG: hypothetical protein G3M78_12865 [Candidatus Nitrohelix vancouverensis]
MPAINLILGTLILVIVALGVKTWTHPKYPSRVDGQTVSIAPKIFEELKLSRKIISPDVVNQVTSKNLFRQQRAEYIPPPPPPASVSESATAVAQVPATPPPTLELKGVMLINGKNIAILDGEFSVRDTNNVVSKKPVKRKGYSVGDQIGDYRVEQIERSHVTLSNQQGSALIVPLNKRTATETIGRRGNELYHKAKNFSPNDLKIKHIKKKSPPIPKPAETRTETPSTPQRTQGIAPAPVASAPPPVAIAPPAHVSGGAW